MSNIQDDTDLNNEILDIIEAAEQAAKFTDGLADDKYIARQEKIIDGIAALVARREAEANGCPCLLTEPCSYMCSCAKPIMSGGCLRCCRYGSLEQRKQKAERLAALRSASRKEEEDENHG